MGLRVPAIGSVLLLMSVNGLVRGAGGDVSLLSVRYSGQRARALGHLAWHKLTCFTHGDDAQAIVREAAVRNHVPPEVALAVARAESGFKHTCISGTGAMGLMQLMPRTAEALGVNDPFDPAQNADGGTRYLADLLRQYRGDTQRALAAYNAGMGNVPSRGAMSVPPETKRYVARVMAFARSLGRASRRDPLAPVP
jgi:soluble lytic murein transglycosylase-like protein